MATLLDTISDAWLLATRKSTLPASGSEKRNALIALAKKFYKDWQTEKGTDWDSLYEVVSAGAIVATDTYTIATDIHRICNKNEDKIRVFCLDGNYVNFTLCPASKLYSRRYENYVARKGQLLTFSRTFKTTDIEFGGSIQVPAIIKLDDLTSESDEILLDNPAWLSAITAAQYVLSDARLTYQYDDLLAQANELMEAMKVANTTEDTTSSGVNYFDNGSGYE